MSSPQQPSSPVTGARNESSSPAPTAGSIPAQPSSPALFYNSSSSQSDIFGRHGSQAGTARNNAAFGSSPMNYPSSSQNQSSDLLNPQRRTRRPGGSSTNTPGTTRFSDIRSDRNIPSSSSSFGSSRNNIRMRRNDIHASDLSSPRRIVDFDSHSGVHTSSSSAVPTSDANEPLRIIWGTNVSIQECATKFRNFLMSFKYKFRKTLDEREQFINSTTDEELYYVQQLNEMREVGNCNLNLDARNLLAFKQTEELYYQLLNYPQEVISIMDQTIKDCMVSLVVDNHLDFNLDDIETKFYKVRPYNVGTVKGMRELNPNDIDKLISLKGLVLRATPVIPDMKVAFFKCNVCDHTMVVEIDRGVIQEPARCERVDCGEQNSMSLIHNRCSFADKQVIKLQELSLIHI